MTSAIPARTTMSDTVSFRDRLHFFGSIFLSAGEGNEGGGAKVGSGGGGGVGVVTLEYGLGLASKGGGGV